MIRSIVPRLIVALALLAGTALAETRSWTRASDGKAIKGEYVGLKDPKTVTIKMGAKNVDIPLNVLSEADQKFIADLNKPADAATPAKPGQKMAIPKGETTLTLSKVHVCCRDCEEAVQNVLTNKKLNFTAVESVKLESSRKDGTIKVTASSGKDASMALSGLLAGGFYGVSDHPAVKIRDLKEDDFMSNTMSVRDINLLCSGRVKAAKKVFDEFKGTEYDIKGNPSTVVLRAEDGDNIINLYTVMQKLRAVGLGGNAR